MLAHLLVQLLTKQRSQEVVNWVVSLFPKDPVGRARYAKGVAELQLASGKVYHWDSGKVFKLLKRAKPSQAIPVLYLFGRYLSQGTELDRDLTTLLLPEEKPYCLFLLYGGKVGYFTSAKSAKATQDTEVPVCEPSSVKLRNHLALFIGRHLG